MNKPTHSVAESVQLSHVSANRAERILGDMIDRLIHGCSMPVPSTNEPMPPIGLAEDAFNLSCRIERLANMADEISRLVAPPPEKMASTR